MNLESQELCRSDDFELKFPPYRAPGDAGKQERWRSGRRGDRKSRGHPKGHTSAAERKIYQAQNRLKRWAVVAKAAKDKEMAEFLGVDLQMETAAEHRRREAFLKKKLLKELGEGAGGKTAPVPPANPNDAEMEDEEALLNGRD